MGIRVPEASDGGGGAAFLKGAGAPGAGLGADGDMYFDTTAKALYGPKTAGAWGSAEGLQGPAGADGADGAAGAAGPAGPAGGAGGAVRYEVPAGNGQILNATVDGNSQRSIVIRGWAVANGAARVRPKVNGATLRSVRIN